MKKLFLIAIIAIIGTVAEAQTAEKATVEIQTNGVCKMCEDLFAKNVPFFKGVTDYSYDAATAKMKVTYSTKKTTADEIRKGISKLGYASPLPWHLEQFLINIMPPSFASCLLIGFGYFGG